MTTTAALAYTLTASRAEAQDVPRTPAGATTAIVLLLIGALVTGCTRDMDRARTRWPALPAHRSQLRRQELAHRPRPRASRGGRWVAILDPGPGPWTLKDVHDDVVTLDGEYQVNYLWDGTKFLRLTEDRIDGGGRRSA